ncbi:MAG: hypothetical protein OXG15_01575 [Gammaproteobacteria bacterium]|nr:hypothetical protein [Gammaproteobacteria bacterium]
MTLLDVFQRLEEMWIGEAIRTSYWLFPFIEAIHLVGLALLGGTVIVVDLRLLGLTLRSRPANQVLLNARPYFVLALLTMFATGVPLALSEMIKLYYNFSWWVKISTLGIAILFTFFVRNPIVLRDNASSVTLAFIGLVSLVLWFTVAGAGRWIGFS